MTLFTPRISDQQLMALSWDQLVSLQERYPPINNDASNPSLAHQTRRRIANEWDRRNRARLRAEGR